MRRRVHLAHTGGTIGMRRTAAGYAPEAGYLAQELAGLQELRHAEMPEWELYEHDPILDSSNLRPSHWLGIARDIVARADDFDGFVVLHGTDTMAYTASALAFMLRGLGKPVVLTGSQIPLFELRSDGRENLLTAMLIAAAEPPIPEVGLCFGARLLRGCRAVKVNASGFDAFDSPNCSPLANVGVDIEVDWNVVRAPEGPESALPERLDATVGALRLFPGISAELVRNALRAAAARTRARGLRRGQRARRRSRAARRDRGGDGPRRGDRRPHPVPARDGRARRVRDRLGADARRRDPRAST